MEVVDEAAEDGPLEVGFRPDTDGFSLWAGEQQVVAVRARADRLAFAVDVFAEGRCDRPVADRILTAVEGMAAGPAALVDSASAVLRDQARRRGYQGPLRAPLVIGARLTGPPAGAPAARSVEAAVSELIGRPVTTEEIGGGRRRFLDAVRRGSPRAVRRLTVDDPRLVVTIPDTPDLMVESVARAVDTILAVRALFKEHATHLDVVHFDHTSEAEAARWAGQANAMVFSIHLNDNLVVADRWVAHRRGQEAAGPSRSAMVPHPFSRVDGVAAHEAWHQIEFKFRGRHADYIAFKRELGGALGVATLEHAIQGRQRNAPPELMEACRRLATTVSPYATTNPLEAAAEMFKLWWCGVSNPTIDCFGGLLDRYFGIGSVRPRG